jgi:chromosome segregation ATPase
MISGLNTALGAAIGISHTLPSGVFQGLAAHSWNESCTEMPASVYAPSVFENPVKARVCFPDGMVGILGNSTETLEFPLPGSAQSELFGFRLPASHTNYDWTISISCILVPLCFLLWTSITRRPSTVDDRTIPKKSYVDAAIAEISSRIPDLAPLVANQRRLEGQVIQIESVEARVNGRIENRIHELEVLFKKQIRDINLEPLTWRADHFQENHEFVASQVRKLQEDQPRWTHLAEEFKDLKTDLTAQIERKTDRVQANIKEHFEDIEERFKDLENQNKKLVINVKKVAKEQTTCNAIIDQLQKQVHDIDELKKQFKGLKDGVVPITERVQKLQQQVDYIGSPNERARDLEEMTSINEQIRQLQDKETTDIHASKENVMAVESKIATTTGLIQKLQEQDAFDTKRVKDVESEITSLKELVGDLQEQRQADNTTKAQSQEIETSLNQRIAKVETELHQIPAVKTEEERAHTQMLLENKIEELKIDELRNKLQTIEPLVNEYTQNIIHIQNRIIETELKIQSEFTQRTEKTEQLINGVVQQFGISLDGIVKTISTSQEDFKERTPDKETMEKLKTDLKIAEEKVGSLEMNVFGSSSNVAEPVIVQINEIQSQLQELTDNSKSLSQRQEALGREQDLLKIGAQASSQSSQPQQTPIASKTPSKVNASAAEVVPSPRTQTFLSQSTTHSARPEISQRKSPQSQKGKGKGKQRASTLSSQSSKASEYNEQGGSKKGPTTDEKSQKPPAQSPAEVEDSFALKWNLPSLEEKEQMFEQDQIQRESNKILTDTFAEIASKNPKTLAQSRWAS